MARFQMVDSENPNTIADVSSDVDINSFRIDKNWYEIVDVVAELETKPVKTVKKTKELE
jgi:hypothetical protein